MRRLIFKHGISSVIGCMLSAFLINQVSAETVNTITLDNLNTTESSVVGCITGQAETRYVFDIGDSSGRFGEIGTKFVTTDVFGAGCAEFGFLVSDTPYVFRVRNDADRSRELVEPFTTTLTLTQLDATPDAVTGCFTAQPRTRYVVDIGDSSGRFGEIGTKFVTTDVFGAGCAEFGFLVSDTPYVFRVRNDADRSRELVEPFTTQV
ncbi:MAG: hypothetical protein GFH27_549347n94 [Chloroflexi bacterium AL-W]|nr:hypothetical protein [Chloroflexi bacterium AL-N5]NOK85417.1 hypothetical protein [Chloroflexi bacterium AL-W]